MVKLCFSCLVAQVPCFSQCSREFDSFPLQELHRFSVLKRFLPISTLSFLLHREQRGHGEEGNSDRQHGNAIAEQRTSRARTSASLYLVSRQPNTKLTALNPWSPTEPVYSGFGRLPMAVVVDAVCTHSPRPPQTMLAPFITSRSNAANLLPTARGRGVPVPTFLLKAAYLVTKKGALKEQVAKVNCGSSVHKRVTGLLHCLWHKSLGLSFLFLSACFCLC